MYGGRRGEMPLSAGVISCRRRRQLCLADRPWRAAPRRRPMTVHSHGGGGRPADHLYQEGGRHEG